MLERANVQLLRLALILAQLLVIGYAEPRGDTVVVIAAVVIVVLTLVAFVIDLVRGAA